ncbi:MAG: helix-turn-helix transcriptional regulator [Phycisphaeraceae bacterium]
MPASHKNSVPVPLEKRLFWRISEAAQMLGRSRQTVYKLIGREEIPRPVTHATLGRGWPAGQLRAWIAAGMPNPKSWRWSAAALPSLDRLIGERREELERIGKQIRQAQAELAELDAKTQQRQRNTV